MVDLTEQVTVHTTLVGDAGGTVMLNGDGISVQHCNHWTSWGRTGYVLKWTVAGQELP